MDNKTKPEVRIENWSINVYDETYETLSGRIDSHHTLNIGELERYNNQIRTSKIVKKDLEGKRVETLNTIYILGKPLSDLLIMNSPLHKGLHR